MMGVFGLSTALLLTVVPISAPVIAEAGSMGLDGTGSAHSDRTQTSPLGPTKDAAPRGARPELQWRHGSPTLTWGAGDTTLRPLGQLIVDLADTTGARDPTRNRKEIDVRAAHLGFAGTVAKSIVYQLETEFAGDSTDILWAYVGWRGTIGGIGADLLVGNLQNDRGVEGSSGGEALPFPEPNFVASTIAPDRGGFGFGAQARLIGATWHASVAITGNDIDARRPQTGDRTILGRAHWNPIKQSGRIVHLGGWAFDETFRGKTRTLGADANVAYGLNIRTVLPSPPLVGATGDHGYGLEAGGIVGPVWIMGEAGRRTIDLPQSTAHSTAGSISAGWFVTGEAPPYAAATGGFGRPIVARSVFEGGRGQVELTARYEKFRFREPGFRNTGSCITGGVNWYLSSQMRLMLDVSAWHMAPDPLMAGAGPRTDRGTTFVLRTQFVL